MALKRVSSGDDRALALRDRLLTLVRERGTLELQRGPVRVVALRTGPGSNCNLIVRVPWSAWVDLNCYRLGESVHGFTTWSAVHYAQYFGWISDYHLSGGGTNRPCAS